VPDVESPPQDLTTWRLGEIETSVKAILGKLEEVNAANLADRVKRLEDWQTWALRIVVGAVLLAVLAVVIGTTK
jgi:hypothetical protein